MGINKYIILILTTLSVLACKKENTTLTKVVLVSNISNTEKKEFLDSIVYLYNSIQNDKIYVSQSTHIGKNKKTYYYYLQKKENMLFLGIETNKDSVIYYPYCSFVPHDTTRYDISYLDNINGFTTLVKDVNSLKEYTGDMAFINFIETPFWVYNKNFKIEKIQSGNLVLKKELEESLLECPDDYHKPVNNPIEVFIPLSGEYFHSSTKY